MKVLKFGGTSVGSIESILSLKRIVEGQPDNVIVVVSALGGITDKLIATSKMAVAGDKDWQKEFDTRDAAVAFAADEHYVICQLPCSLDPKRNANKTEEVDEEEVE